MHCLRSLTFHIHFQQTAQCQVEGEVKDKGRKEKDSLRDHKAEEGAPTDNDVDDVGLLQR